MSNFDVLILNSWTKFCCCLDSNSHLLSINTLPTTRSEKMKHNNEQLKLQVWLVLHNIFHVRWYLTWAKLYEIQKIKHIIHTPTIFTIMNITNANWKKINHLTSKGLLFSTPISPNNVGYHLELHVVDKIIVFPNKIDHLQIREQWNWKQRTWYN